MSRPAYQSSPEELRDPIWAAGHFTPLQMFRVAAWKSAQGLAWLTLNTDDDIVERTAHAIDIIRDWRNRDVLVESVDWDAWTETVATAIGSKEAHTGLLGLEGVGYPRATAFLAFLAPSAFPATAPATAAQARTSPIAARLVKGLQNSRHTSLTS